MSLTKANCDLQTGGIRSLSEALLRHNDSRVTRYQPRGEEEPWPFPGNPPAHPQILGRSASQPSNIAVPAANASTSTTAPVSQVTVSEKTAGPPLVLATPIDLNASPHLARALTKARWGH